MQQPLIELGLSPYFTQQLTADELDAGNLARVVEVQRSGIVASDGSQEWFVSLGGHWTDRPAESRPTTGDWILLDESGKHVLRLLERKSVFKRVAAGTRVEVQLIAANVDTLFVVTSCNNDCNESRLERYLALAYAAGVDPLVVLTKADLVDDADLYRARVRALHAELPVETVDARDPAALAGVLGWVCAGSTVALVGSSGVGKSTIVNTLSGADRMATAAIREDDARGRHTTTYRSLHVLPAGGILLDVPGMRELKVAEVSDSLGEVFAEIEILAAECRFRDCTHEKEPGCRVREAIDAGEIDPRRFANYRKLLREEARYSRSIAKQRQRERSFGKLIRQHIEHKRNAGRKHPTGRG